MTLISTQARVTRLLSPFPAIASNRRQMMFARGLPTQSDKSGDIEAGYDAYALCGLALSFLRAMNAFRKTVLELRKSGQTYRAITVTATNSMCTSLRPLLFADVLAKLRQITKAPIYVMATPLPAMERHPEFDKLGGYLKSTLLPAYNTACERVASESDAIFLAQPTETTGTVEFATKKEFYLLPPENVRNEKALHTHINAAFGAIVLKDALEHVRAAEFASSSP